MIWDQYTYRVSWSPEDNEHVGTVAEFPGLSWLAESSADAFAGIQRVVREAVEEMEAAGEAVPEPIAGRSFSGKIPFRTTPQMHRKLALEAAEEKVSLNRYLNARLGA